MSENTSWLDTIIDYGSQAVDWFTGSSVTASLARTAVTGYALNRVTASINKDNEAARASETTPDTGTRIRLDPDTENKIPVVYGQAHVQGIVTDAYLTEDNKTMFFVITLSEKTGLTNLGTGAASVINFNAVYWNDQKINFRSDGITASSTVDRQGNPNSNIDGLVKVYCFNNGSNGPVSPVGYNYGGLQAAYNIMPGWTANHTMSDLVFAIVRVDYNKEKSITSLGNLRFYLNNSMTQAGDCIYDMMTNARYGAGIQPSEINSL